MSGFAQGTCFHDLGFIYPSSTPLDVYELARIACIVRGLRDFYDVFGCHRAHFPLVLTLGCPYVTFQAPQLACFLVMLEVMTLIQSDGLLRGINTDLNGRCISASLLVDTLSLLHFLSFVNYKFFNFCSRVGELLRCTGFKPTY